MSVIFWFFKKKANKGQRKLNLAILFSKNISVGLLGKGAYGEVYGAVNRAGELISVKMDLCEPDERS